MKEFFPTGKKSCPVTGITDCAVSVGVWGYECCGFALMQCCGYVSVAGWILVGALALLIILAIAAVLCRRR